MATGVGLVGQRMARSSARKSSKGLVDAPTKLPDNIHENGHKVQFFIPRLANGVASLAVPVHKPDGNDSIIPNVRNKAGKMFKFKPSVLACMDAVRFAEYSPEVAKKIAHTGGVCPYCEMARWTHKLQTKLIEETYPNGEFDSMTKSEKKDFYQKVLPTITDDEGNAIYRPTVSANYYFKDEVFNVHQLVETLVGIPQIESYTEKKQVKRKVKGEVKVVERDVTKYRPVMEEVTYTNAEGEEVTATVPKMSWELRPLSTPQMNKISNAVDNAFEKDTYDGLWDSIYVEAEGTEHEEEIRYANLGMAFNYGTASDKMTAVKDMTIDVLEPGETFITEEFLEYVESIQDKLTEDAIKLFNRLHKDLLVTDRETFFNNMDEEVVAYYDFLKEEVGDALQEDGESDTVLQDRLNDFIKEQKWDIEDVEVEEDADVADEKPEAKKSDKKASKKTEQKASKKVEEEEDLEIDEDLDIEEEDIDVEVDLDEEIE